MLSTQGRGYGLEYLNRRRKQAARVYDRAAFKLKGPLAILNFPTEYFSEVVKEVIGLEYLDNSLLEELLGADHDDDQQ
ncbi:hypothetical protein FXO38_08855 [Capsicum annuum]|nr:hypothetical protein FXO37_17976 [Capsicum annuum]KAF3666925.1 hypothetical protein FXO38_08855 [Capsicum annuum]